MTLQLSQCVTYRAAPQRDELDDLKDACGRRFTEVQAKRRVTAEPGACIRKPDNARERQTVVRIPQRRRLDVRSCACDRRRHAASRGRVKDSGDGFRGNVVHRERIRFYIEREVRGTRAMKYG
jgi:hypothetical protein